jgi:hypothetical protein
MTPAIKRLAKRYEKAEREMMHGDFLGHMDASAAAEQAAFDLADAVVRYLRKVEKGARGCR